jgi:hypothetical protein
MIKIKFLNWDKYNKRKDYKRQWWFAMANDFPIDPKFYNFKNDEKLCFVYLLCEASKQDTNGEVSIIPEHHSRLWNVSIKTLEQVIDLLESVQIANVIRTESVRYITEHNITEHNKYMCDSDESHAAKFAFEDIYKIYPKRLGSSNKAKGLERLKRIVKTQSDFDDAMKAVKNYSEWCKQTNKERTELVKMFSSFFDPIGSWREWITYQPEAKKNPFSFLEKYSDGDKK